MKQAKEVTTTNRGHLKRTSPLEQKLPLGSMPEIGRIGSQLVGDASLAIFVLLLTRIVSVFNRGVKPDTAAYRDVGYPDGSQLGTNDG